MPPDPTLSQWLTQYAERAHVAPAEAGKMREAAGIVTRAREACEAAVGYDAAIRRRASSGRFTRLADGGGSARGDDLDALYDDWITKARRALGETGI